MFSQISDGELDDFVTSAQQSHPNIGIRMVKGLLESKGHCVQKERIRQSLLRTDPIGVHGSHGPGKLLEKLLGP